MTNGDEIQQILEQLVNNPDDFTLQTTRTFGPLRLLRFTNDETGEELETVGTTRDAPLFQNLSPSVQGMLLNTEGVPQEEIRGGA